MRSIQYFKNWIKHGWLIKDHHYVWVYYFREKFPWNRAEMSLDVWLTLVEGWCAVDVSWDERRFRLFSDCVVPHSSDSTLLDEQTAMKHWSLSLGGKNCMLHLFLICTVAPKRIWMLLDTSVVLDLMQWHLYMYDKISKKVASRNKW